MSRQSFPLAATTTTPPAKPNPSYFQSADSQYTIQQKEVLLHLYTYQYGQGTSKANQAAIVDPKLPKNFGVVAANDWSIYDGLADDPGAKIVARAQGLHIGSGMINENWFMCFSMVFVDERYGST
jgi:hypothetical protein